MKRIGKKLMYMALSLFVIFQVYLFIRFYWIVSCFIPTYSMAPTLLGGDYIIVSMQIPGRRIMNSDSGRLLVHRLKGQREVQRNDVVVFNFPYAEDKEKMIISMNTFYCKRCVGVPGDTCRWCEATGMREVYLPKIGDILRIDSCNYEHYYKCIEYETGKKMSLKMGQVYLEVRYYHEDRRLLLKEEHFHRLRDEEKHAARHHGTFGTATASGIIQYCSAVCSKKR